MGDASSSALSALVREVGGSLPHLVGIARVVDGDLPLGALERDDLRDVGRRAGVSATRHRAAVRPFLGAPSEVTPTTSTNCRCFRRGHRQHASLRMQSRGARARARGRRRWRRRRRGSPRPLQRRRRRRGPRRRRRTNDGEEGPHTQCALLWCDEATARDPPSGCVPVDPVAGLASLGPGYRGVRGAEAVAALVGACASAAHVVPDATQRSKPDEELRITPSPSSEPLAVSPSAMALCVRVAAALGDDDGWRPTRVCELGSGTGAAGLLVARMLTSTRGARELGARPLVLLTDRDTAALEVVASNVRLNARGWARCVPQRLQWDRRDERSRVTRRAADDDRIPLHDQTHSSTQMHSEDLRPECLRRRRSTSCSRRTSSAGRGVTTCATCWTPRRSC